MGWDREPESSPVRKSPESQWDPTSDPPGLGQRVGKTGPLGSAGTALAERRADFCFSPLYFLKNRTMNLHKVLMPKGNRVWGRGAGKGWIGF